MKRLASTTLLVAAAAVASAARADFDETSGTVSLADAALSFDFEGGTAPAARIAKIAKDAIPSLIDGLPAAWAVDTAIEGRRALRVPGDHSLVLGNMGALSALHEARIELRFWARSDGARPSGRLVYGREEIDGRGLFFPDAAIDAIETGRATDDGWVEYSTGPVDAAIGHHTKLTGVVFEADASPTPSAGFLVDGVAIVRRDARPTRPDACTLATEDATCGDDGACIEGACYDGAIVWGALPPAGQRDEIVRRHEQYLVRVSSDRYGAERARTMFVPAAKAAAQTATSARKFWQPFQRAAASARGAHTRVAGPSRFHSLSWQSPSYVRSEWNELLACFGLVDRDISGGGRGYAVFQAAPTSPLKPGDVIETIDGEAPAAWLERASPMTSLSSDPDADEAVHGSSMQALVPALARTLEVTRCKSATACTGADATKVVIDLVALRKNVQSLPADTQPLCSIRFRRGVEIPAGRDPESYEEAFESVDADGVVHVLTNGEPDGNQVADTVGAAFERKLDKMIIDKRRGDGGGGASLEVWAQRVRQDPLFRMFTASRWTYDVLDPPASIFSQLSSCDSEFSNNQICWALSASWYGIAASSTPRPAKIAWLNVVDGSASDLAAAYAKGVPGVRMFAPNRTMGLFGGLHHLPRFASGLSDVYVQRSDTRIGSTWDAVTAAAWQSGKGIEPDERIAQKQSDVLLGRDTMLERAKAWVKGL